MELLEKELMTLKDIAQALGLPESTLRKYRDAYPQFIPYVGSGRERRYREDAVAVFKTIRDCRVDKHLSWEDTEKEMIGRFPVNADAVGKKAAVSEDEGNIFLEKLERAVRQLTSQGERQEFVTSTLAGELLKMKKDADRLVGIEKEVQALRKSTYSYNEVVQRQYKEGQKESGRILEILASLQSALYMVPNEVARAVGTKAGMETIAALAAPAGADLVSSERESALVAKLREQFKEKEAEAEKFRELYIKAKREIDKAKREIDRLREELKKKTIEEMYGAKRPGAQDISTGSAAQVDEGSARGGKFFFKGRKKE